MANDQQVKELMGDLESVIRQRDMAIIEKECAERNLHETDNRLHMILHKIKEALKNDAASR